MENEDTRLSLEDAWQAAIEDYAQRVAIVVGTDKVLCTTLATFAVMDIIDQDPDSANTFKYLMDRVRAELTAPWVVEKQNMLNKPCDCLTCQITTKLEALERKRAEEAKEAE